MFGFLRHIRNLPALGLGSDPLLINAYQSYGTGQHLYALGRALEDEGVNLQKKGFLNTIKNTIKQFKSDELPNTALTVKLPDGRSIKTKTDQEGYYKIDQQVKGLDLLTNESGWLQMEVSYTNQMENSTYSKNNRFPAEMLIPSQNAEYGVISDIDDTILHTGVTSLMRWRVILNTFFTDFGNRTPLKGAVKLYQKLHQGSTGQAANPIFYVSNSPWNLYNYLQGFIRNNNFPKGAILLRDFRTPFDKTPRPEKPHKQHEIRNILNTYPELSFVLIGDSGEHDADIYIEIAEEFPERIKAIYLRSVNHEKRVFRVRGLLEGFKATPALLVKDSATAEEHARGLGLIR